VLYPCAPVKCFQEFKHGVKNSIFILYIFKT